MNKTNKKVRFNNITKIYNYDNDDYYYYDNFYKKKNSNELKLIDKEINESGYDYLINYNLNVQKFYIEKKLNKIPNNEFIIGIFDDDKTLNYENSIDSENSDFSLMFNKYKKIKKNKISKMKKIKNKLFNLFKK